MSPVHLLPMSPVYTPLIKGGSFEGSVSRELNHQSPPFAKGDLGGFEEDRNQEVAPTEPEQTVRQPLRVFVELSEHLVKKTWSFGNFYLAMRPKLATWQHSPEK